VVGFGVVEGFVVGFGVVEGLGVVEGFVVGVGVGNVVKTQSKVDSSNGCWGWAFHMEKVQKTQSKVDGPNQSRKVEAQ
jgi:hypothetical protein